MNQAGMNQASTILLARRLLPDRVFDAAVRRTYLS